MTNQDPVERIYVNDTRVRPETINHHVQRYLFAATHLKNAIAPSALDIACGTGYGADILAKAGADVVGIDIDESAVKYANNHFGNGGKARFVICDAPKAVCDTYLGVFSLITMFEALEHLRFSEGLAIISHIEDRLLPGGVFIVSVPRDVNEKYNHFHKSCWTYEMLLNYLGDYFDDVKIYGQDWDTAMITENNVKENDFYIAVCK